MTELEISGLSKTYRGGIQALRNVSLRIPTGMFGLLGPNGAGKSTLMRTIATLQEPDSGTISFDGLDVLGQKDEVRRILGYLPQDFGVYPRVTAGALLDHLAVLKGITDRTERREAVDALLQKTNLYQHRKAKLGTFSGGMKQRFGIAQALLGAPKLVIVDEPTAGLDPEERLRFHNLLSEIGENIVVILSTHIVEDVSDLCSRMAVISKGEVLLEGEPAKAIDEIRGRVYRRVVAREDLEGYEREHRVIATHLSAGKTVIHVYGESGAPPGPGFEPVEPGLEDVYFATMK
jgi:ABC-type multidrug transport system ATPase subunit